MEYKLRKYQQDAVDKGFEVLSSKTASKQILVLPTGAGKSIILSQIANQLDGNVLVVQPSKELLAQNLDKLRALGGEACVYSASFNSKEIGKITYATIGSLKAKEFTNSNIKYIIQDEAHLCTQENSNLSKFIKELGIKNVLGLTATPLYLKTTMTGSQLKMMNRVQGKMYSKICHVTQISELVKDNFWSPIEYEVIDVDNNSLEYNSTGSDYTLKSMIVNYQNNGIEKKIADKVKTITDRKSILIFVPTIEDAERLKTKIKNSEVVHSKLNVKERDRVINGFKALEIPVVINVNVLAVGFDHPELSCIITARPTASIAMFYQQLGRGVRIHPNKKNCKIIDYSGNVSKFGMLENLNFEDVEGFGWGLFNGETLLTNVPMWEDNKPTKEQLRNGRKVEDAFEIPFSERSSEVQDSFFFGKHKGKKVSAVFKEDKNYLNWLIGNKEFLWNGAKMKALKVSIEKELSGVSSIKIESPRAHKEILSDYTQKINLNNLW
jgi:DNA repair protein RadD